MYIYIVINIHTGVYNNNNINMKYRLTKIKVNLHTFWDNEGKGKMKE